MVTGVIAPYGISYVIIGCLDSTYLKLYHKLLVQNITSNGIILQNDEFVRKTTE